MSSNRAWVFGDNIDTDQIIPSQYLVAPSLETMKQHTFAPQGRDFARLVRTGDIVVGGVNFGCGSSREQAPLVLQACGVQAVIAKSFARIFFRNSINLGLFLIELPEADEILDGEQLMLDVEQGTLISCGSGRHYKFDPPAGLPRQILNEGGLLNYLVKVRARQQEQEVQP